MKAETGNVCVCAEQEIVCKWCTLKLMQQAAAAPPMTPEQQFEQRVSWVFGQIGGTVTKDEIRKQLRGL